MAPPAHQLSLFEEPSAPAPPLGPRPADRAHRRPSRRGAEAATPPALSLPGLEVPIRLRRTARRSIGLRLSAQGLEVTAPLRLGLPAIEEALRRKAGWIARHMQRLRQQQASQPAPIVWADGARLPWLGGELLLRTDAAGPPGQERVSLGADGSLWVRLAPAAGAAQLRDAVQAWMQQQALAHFGRRVAHFAPLLGVAPRAIKLSSARTRWGSAKTDGTIRLHWRLMHMPPEVLDYVVVHELAHLRHMNHSVAFWQTVERILPDYAQLRARLRGQQLPAW